MYRWPRPLRLAKERECKKNPENPLPDQVDADVSFTCNLLIAFFLHPREKVSPLTQKESLPLRERESLAFITFPSERELL